MYVNSIKRVPPAPSIPYARVNNGRGQKKTKADQKKATEIAEINKCVPIFDIRFTDPGMLKEILVPQLDLQLKWHRLRELEMDKKTQIPPLSKLKKQQKAELIVAAVGRWRPQVDAGEVPLMGFQSSEPLESPTTRRMMQVMETENNSEFLQLYNHLKAYNYCRYLPIHIHNSLGDSDWPRAGLSECGRGKRGNLPSKSAAWRRVQTSAKGHLMPASCLSPL
jgi:hypothetical protein